MSVHDVVLPALSESMDEGTIGSWLVAAGDEVSAGDPLVEIETDKATSVFEADAGGSVLLLVAEGTTVPVGAVIARIGDPSALAAGDAGADGGAAAVADEGPASGATPGPRRAAAAAPAAPSTDQRAPQGTAPPAPRDADGRRVRSSPVARRVAAARGVDLTVVAGSGPNGRVVKADVLAVDSAAAAPVAPAGATTVPLTRRQALVARRMSEAKQTIPEFTVTTEVDMTAAVALREQLREVWPEDRPLPSYNDLVTKVVAVALRDHPRANASYSDDAIQLHPEINVGFAVESGDDLIVPTIRRCDELSLAAIAAETRRLAGRVRDATVTPEELGHGTFTISNLGMLGVSEFVAVINPPQVAILAVGALGYAAFDVDGAPQLRRAMRLTLTVDHRVLYGAHAARLLRDIRRGLERPALLLAGTSGGGA